MERALIQLVWARAHDRCEYCQFPAEISLLPFQIDHIIAEKHGGLTTADNLALSCERCNSHKGPNIAGQLRGNLIPLFHPRLQQWQDHFRWQGAALIGKSLVGEVTIQVLEINHPDRVAIREAIIAEGIFPPAL